MIKIKIDPDRPLRDYLMQHCKRTDEQGELWAHSEHFFHWDGAYLYLVYRGDVPDSVLEALKLDSVL
jgi:hypothetical protein